MGQNTFLGRQDFCFYYVWNNFFWAQHNLWGHNQNTAPECPPWLRGWSKVLIKRNKARIIKGSAGRKTTHWVAWSRTPVFRGSALQWLSSLWSTLHLHRFCAAPERCGTVRSQMLRLFVSPFLSITSVEFSYTHTRLQVWLAEIECYPISVVFNPLSQVFSDPDWKLLKAEKRNFIMTSNRLSLCTCHH